MSGIGRSRSEVEQILLEVAQYDSSRRREGRGRWLAAFAEGMRRWLRKSGLSRSEAASKAGCSMGTIKAVCEGRRKPGIEILEALAIVFPFVAREGQSGLELRIARKRRGPK